MENQGIGVGEELLYTERCLGGVSGRLGGV
jgi:hypothetical protein